MKKIILMTLMFVCGIMLATAQTANGGKQAEIKFDKTTHNFGKFSESAPKVSCTFTFTNVGDAPLIINQAVASCGCTATEYTKTPVKPGEKGELKITYNGEGKFPGHFKKSITVRTNGKVEMTRLYVEGDMEEVKNKSDSATTEINTTGRRKKFLTAVVRSYNVIKKGKAEFHNRTDDMEWRQHCQN